MATVVLVLMSVVTFGSSAQAVTDATSAPGYTMTFHAYVKKGERINVTASGHKSIAVLNENGSSVGVSGGYTPTAGSDGVWRVTITQRAGQGPGLGYTYNVSVRASTTEQKGRIWVYEDSFEQPTTSGLMTYYGVSDLGYVYQIKMYQVRGYTASIALRSTGAAPDSKCNVQNRSYDAKNGVRLTAYLDCGDKYKLFFEDPRSSGLPTTAKMGNTTIPVLPTLVTSAQLNSSTKVAFTPNSDKVGGSFAVTSHAAFSGTAELQIDTNNNGSYTDAVDITQTVVIKQGAAAWTWDGKDAKGAEVRAGGKARVTISKGGEAHLLLHDMEYFGGLTMTRLNGDSPNSTIYWDDSKIVQARAGAPTSAKTCLGGCNSNVTGGIHGWTVGPAIPGIDNSTSWGDGSVIDNWAFASVSATSPAIALPALRTLTFNGNGGSISGATSINRTNGLTWGTLPTASKANNDFLGWFTATSGGTKLATTTVANGNLTAYAQWQLTPRTLTFNANGGTISGATSITKPHGSAWGTLPTASKTGHVFLGWYTATSGGSQVTSTVAATITMTAYAQWRPAKFNVVFDGNAQTGKVTGATGSVMVEYGCTTCLLPANGFTKTTGAPALIDPDSGEKTEVNSTFLGWSLDPLSRKGDIADRAVAGKLSQTDGATVRLYAIWDDAPRFIVESYPNRFFNLSQAKGGSITEAELLSTVKATDKETNPLLHKTSAQVQSSGSDVGVTLFDYDATDFTSLTESGVVTVTYKVKDGVGNVAFLRIRVTVSDSSALTPDAAQYLRGISPGYKTKGSGEGGLSEGSLWRTDPTRQAALDRALSSNATTTYCLNADAVAELRAQVRAGLGNSETPGGLAAAVALLRSAGACS